jgi:hypothetical protein
MRPGRNVSFIVFVIGAITAGANAGRMAALLHATGTLIVAWSALTFTGVSDGLRPGPVRY